MPELVAATRGARLLWAARVVLFDVHFPPQFPILIGENCGLFEDPLVRFEALAGECALIQNWSPSRAPPHQDQAADRGGRHLPQDADVRLISAILLEENNKWPSSAPVA